MVFRNYSYENVDSEQGFWWLIKICTNFYAEKPSIMRVGSHVDLHGPVLVMIFHCTFRIRTWPFSFLPFILLKLQDILYTLPRTHIYKSRASNREHLCFVGKESNNQIDRVHIPTTNTVKKAKLSAFHLKLSRSLPSISKLIDGISQESLNGTHKILNAAILISIYTVSYALFQL